MSVGSDTGRTGFTVQAPGAQMRETVEENQYERWMHIHVNWTAAWTGALAAFCAVVVFGLIGIAVGAHTVGAEHRVVDFSRVGLWTLVFSVCTAFFAFAIGGWICGKVAGILHAEPAMLHGAVSWLVCIPLLMGAAAIGAGGSYGGWYGGVTGNPSWAAPGSAPFARPEPLPPNATAEELTQYRAQQARYTENLQQWNEATPRAIRNSALGAVTALLLGLMGSVIGGWMASGEPMNFAHYRTRKPIYHQPV